MHRMPFTELFRPDCFSQQFDVLFNGKFPKSQKNAAERIVDIINNPIQGDRCPGYGRDVHIRKVRQGLKEYKISRRDGLRIIFLLNELEKWIFMVAIYYKKDNTNEYKNVQMVKDHLRLILAQLDTLPDA
jgi:hypothetical protein